ncbi:MAG TPA: hypothetical protein VJC16_01845 [Candidatus Nanoarchaeia archaeon]|nr:hypothetical protein [Candidatus Nanoarchaeia archaeon]
MVADYVVRFFDNGTNATTVRVNDHVLFNSTIEERDLIAGFIFSLKNSSTAAWYNYSGVPASGVYANISANHTISSTNGQTVEWKFYVNDSNGTMYEMGAQSFIVADTGLSFSRNGTNFTSIRKRDNGMFNITVEDPDGLAMYIFALKNGTNEAWYNYTARAIGGTSYELRENHSVSSNRSQIVQWKYYANDSGGSMYESAAHTFVVADYALAFTRNGTNFTSIRKRDNGMFNVTAEDSDGLAMYIFSLKNGTNEAWYNYTARAIGGIMYDLRENHSISSNRSQLMQWKYYVNDSNGTMYESATHTVAIEDYVLSFSRVGTNFTALNLSQNAQFNATVEDADGLEMYIFALRNASGVEWYNYSAKLIGGTNYPLRENHTIGSPPGSEVSWKYYVNDSNGTMYESITQSFLMDDQGLTFSQNGTNFTSIRTADRGMFNISASDGDGLSTYIFALKNESNLEWYNYSAVPVSGTTADIQVNHTISSNKSQLVQWRFYVNDSAGTAYASIIHSFVVADYVVRFFDNGTNATTVRVNDHVLFNSTIEERDIIAGFIFSLKNSSTAAWYNYSGVPASGVYANISANHTISSTNGQTVEWKFYVNDSNGTMYEMGAQSFIVADTGLSFSRNGTNFTSIRKRDNGMFNVTAEDSDGLAMYIFALKNGTNAEWYNYTARAIGGTSYELRENHSVSSNRSQEFQWKYYVNDSGGSMYESATQTVLVDDFALLFTQNGTNFTSIRTNENGLFNATVEDADGMEAYIFSLKNSSSAAWYNYSAAGIGGKRDAFLNASHAISSISGQTAEWKYYVNDSNGTVYESATHAFTVADTALAFTQNGTNFSSIRKNEHGLFNITVEDPDGLASTIFALKNRTNGAWYNYSAVAAGGTTASISTAHFISSNVSQIVQWKYYANDSTGVMYESDTHSFAVADFIPVFTQNGTNFSSIRANENGLFNVTVEDTDGMEAYIFSLKNSSSAAWYNYSAVGISGKTDAFLNSSHAISSTNGQVAEWKYYVNDSNGTMYESGNQAFTVADTGLSFSRNGTNFTSIRKRDNGMFNITVEDPDGLAMYIFALKNGTNAEWYNYTARAIGGTSYELRENHSVSSNISQIVQWKYYANDSGGSMYESAAHTFVVADYALLFTQNGTNFSSIRTNEHGLLNATLEDQDGLAAYILSVQNSSTDSWFNYSAAQITGNITFIANTSLTVSSTNGETIQWKYYANDTNGTMYEMGVQSFIVADTGLSFSRNGTNFTSIRSGDNGMFNITATDPDGLAAAIFSVRNSTISSWFNFSAFAIGGSSYPILYNYTVRAAAETNFQWKFYVNDTGSTMYESETYNVATSDTVAPRIFLSNPANASQLFVGDWINFTINDTTGVSIGWYSRDAGVANYTLRNSGQLYAVNTTNWQFVVNQDVYVYANDTLGNANQTIFRFNITGLNISISLNASSVGRNRDFNASGVVNFSNGTAVVGQAVAVYVNGTLNSSGLNTNSGGGYNVSVRAPARVGAYEIIANVTHHAADWSTNITVNVTPVGGSAASYSLFGGNTTDFNNQDDISSISGAILENGTHGRISWLGSINASGANLDAYAVMGSRFIFLNATALAGMNVSANLTFYSPGDMFGPVLLKDSILCVQPDCFLLFYDGSNIRFNVTSFSNHTLENSTANISLGLDSSSVEPGATVTLSGVINLTNGTRLANKTFTLFINGTQYYYNNTWDYLVSNVSLGSNDTRTNSTGDYRYRFNATTVSGTYEVMVNGTENGVVFFRNTSLVVAVSGPSCGDNVCNGAETCNTCQADCGVCSGGSPPAPPPAPPAPPAEEPAEEAPAEVAPEVPISEEPLPPAPEEPAEAAVEQEVAENVVVAPELAPQEIAQLQQEALVPVSELPAVVAVSAADAPKGADGEPLETTIDIAKVEIKQTLCEAADYVIEKQASPAEVPKGYSVLVDPFRVSCGEDFSLVFAVPNNYVDVHALVCSGGSCSRAEVGEQETLMCPQEVQEIREDLVFTPDKFQFKISRVEGRVTREAATVFSGEYAAQFSPDAAGMGVRLSQPSAAVPQPQNQFLKIMGTPMVLTFNDAPAKVPATITLPYIRDNAINEDGIGVYALQQGNWTYVGGKVLKERTRVQVQIADVLQYAEDGQARFAAIGELCESCLFSIFKHVYTPPVGSKDAVVLVHGLGSSPATFDQILNDIRATQQPWQAWTFGYPTTKPIEENALEFANQMELYADYYDYIYIAAHSMGGLVTQQAVRYAYEENQKNPGRYRFVSKVKKVILVGTPNRGSPGAQLLRDVVGTLSSSKEAALFDPESSGVYELIEGKSISQVPGIEYYVIAGTRPYELDLGIRKLSSAGLFEQGEINDGIVSVQSAQAVGDVLINNTCGNYWGINTTHTELLFNPVSRKIIERTVAYEILKDVKNTADKPLLGNLKYVELGAACGDIQYLLVGKRVDPNKAPDPTQCSCGNGFCNVDENEYTCPSDCAVIVSVESLVAVLPLLLIVLAMLGLIGSWRAVVKSRRYGALSRWIIVPAAGMLAGSWAYIKLIGIRKSGVVIGSLPTYAYAVLAAVFLITIGYLFFNKLLVLHPARRMSRKPVIHYFQPLFAATDAIESWLVSHPPVRRLLLRIQRAEERMGQGIAMALHPLLRMLRIYRSRREIALIRQREGMHAARHRLRRRLAFGRMIAPIGFAWRALLRRFRSACHTAGESTAMIIRAVSRELLHAVGLRKSAREIEQEIYRKRLAVLAHARAVRRERVIKGHIIAVVAAGKEFVDAIIHKIVAAVREIAHTIMRARRRGALLRWLRWAAAVLLVGGRVWLRWMIRDAARKTLHALGLYRTAEERLKQERKHEAEQLAREEQRISAQLAAEIQEERQRRDAAERDIAAERTGLRKRIRAERMSAERAARQKRDNERRNLPRLQMPAPAPEEREELPELPRAAESVWRAAERKIARERAALARQVRHERRQHARKERWWQRAEQAAGDIPDMDRELEEVLEQVRKSKSKRRAMLEARERELREKLAALQRGERR